MAKKEIYASNIVYSAVYQTTFQFISLIFNVIYNYSALQAVFLGKKSLSSQNI